jgi:hypothetical protein
VECKLRCVNFRRVLDYKRVYLPACGVTRSTGDKPGNADDKPGSNWELRSETWKRRQNVGEHLKSQ